MQEVEAKFNGGLKFSIGKIIFATDIRINLTGLESYESIYGFYGEPVFKL